MSNQENGFPGQNNRGRGNYPNFPSGLNDQRQNNYGMPANSAANNEHSDGPWNRAPWGADSANSSAQQGASAQAGQPAQGWNPAEQNNSAQHSSTQHSLMQYPGSGAAQYPSGQFSASLGHAQQPAGQNNSLASQAGNYPATGYPNASVQPQPGQPSNQPFYAQPRTGDYRPASQRIARDIGAPIALIVVAALLATALSVLAFSGNPVAFLIGMIPSVLGLTIGLGCYMWLDRWEPEPPRLLLTAFLWGGGVATAGAMLIGFLIQLIFVAVGADYTFLFATVIQAPIVEEALKAAWLFIMLSGARRREMNTLTDHLVYAGYSAFGFAFVENLLYFAGAQNFEDVIAMSIIRTGFNLFGHALYTSATAIGIYYARKGSDKLKAGPVILGYLGAVLLHALWNGSASRSLAALIGVYVVLLVPAFAGMVWLGVKSRKQEGEIVNRQLPRMVNEGLVAPQDAAWLQQLQSRKDINKQADKKTPEGGRVRAVSDAVSELSIIRERLQDMAEPSPFLMEEERYLVAALRTQSGQHGPNQGRLQDGYSSDYSAASQGFTSSQNNPGYGPGGNNPGYGPGSMTSQSPDRSGSGGGLGGTGFGQGS